MNKDVIYIDIEDDITAIIGKVKAADNKIVALVPPKRAGVLQSAVNLKLLQKAAVAVDKRVVLITNEHSLRALAAGLKLPVAKNLQSRPEIPHMDAPEEKAEEIINGQELPVGEVQKSLGKDDPAEKRSVADEISEQVELSDATPKPDAAAPGTKSPAPKTSLAAKLNIKHGGKLKVPNFDLFRKRVFLFGSLGVLVIAFLVWAFVFAPYATVTISAKTTGVNIDRTLTLNPAAEASDPSQLTLKPNVQQLKKAVATEFDATGKKDIGNKASGSVTIRNCEYADGELSLPAGTRLTGDNGKVYATKKAVNVEGRTPPTATCTLGGAQAGKTTVEVEAVEIGPEYNVDGQGYDLNVIGKVDAVDGDGMAGGSKETVTVVSQADVDTAKQQLSQQNVDEIKAELKQQFEGDMLIIEESFIAEPAQPASSPMVGEQATRAKLTLETTYTYVAIARSEARQILQAAIDEALKDKADQQMYTLGENSIRFQNFQRREGGVLSARLLTAGSIGPKIETDELAKQLVGKRYGEIEAIVNQIPGVDNVTIQLSPFWVTNAPGTDKIDIKFSVAPNE